jgi:hypothetical protein
VLTAHKEVHDDLAALHRLEEGGYRKESAAVTATARAREAAIPVQGGGVSHPHTQATRFTHSNH